MCGGCTLPGVPYADQLAKKQKELSRLLRLDVPPLIPSPAESGFRCKVAFVFASGPKGKGVVMGHYALGSQRVIRSMSARCTTPEAIESRLRYAITSKGRMGALLRHVIVRTTEDGREASATLVVYRNDKSLRAPVKKFLASTEKPDGFFVNIHDTPGPFMVGDETIKIGERSHVKEMVNGVSHRLADGLLSNQRRRSGGDREAGARGDRPNRQTRLSPHVPDPLLRHRIVCVAAGKGRRESDGDRREPPGDQGCGSQCAPESNR